MDLDKLKDYRALRNAILRLLPYLDSGITELIMNKEKEIWLYKLISASGDPPRKINP